MQIGKARPLCCFFWLVSGIVALYVLVAPSVLWMTVSACAAALLGIVLLLLSIRRSPRRYVLRYIAFLLLAVVVGCSVTVAHEMSRVRPIERYATSLDEQTDTLEGTVISREVESAYLRCYAVRADIEELGTCLVYLSTAEDHSLSVGDRIRFTARVLPTAQAEEEAYLIRSLRTDGYALVAYLEEGSEVALLDTGRFVLRERLGGVQYALSYRLSRAVGLEAGRLTSALLLGTKSELSDGTVLDFRRAGASHLLALSGMHLSLIVLLVDFILRKLRCPYLIRLLLGSAVAIAFLGITGCSISTLRATVMLLCLNVSRLRGVPHDPVTPLSVFFGVCLCIRPAWIYDAGLWLTVLATLCVVEIVPVLLRRGEERERSRVGRVLWRYLISPLLSSCVVLILLVIPMALLFGEISILSPVSNLLLSPLMTALIALGILLLPLLYLVPYWAFLAPLADRLTDALRYLAETMLDITARLSDVRGALVSLRYDFMPVLLLLLLVAVLAFLLLRWERPQRFLAVAALWCIVFAVCLGATSLAARGEWELTYTASGKNETLLLREGSAAVLCDVSDGSYRAVRDLLREGLPPEVTELEALVLTHYHARHIATVYQLLGDIKVRTLWLPMTMPLADNEKAMQDEGILRSVAALARLRRVEVRYYLPSEGAHVLDTLTLDRLYYEMLGRSTHPTVAMSWSHQAGTDTSALFYLGASVWEGKQTEAVLAHLSQADAIVLARHGPVIKKRYQISEWSDAPALVIVTGDDAIAALKPDRETEIALSCADVRVALDQEPLCVRLP